MLDARRRAVLDAMGIEVWRERTPGQGPRAMEVERGSADEPISAQAGLHAPPDTGWHGLIAEGLGEE